MGKNIPQWQCPHPPCLQALIWSLGPNSYCHNHILSDAENHGNIRLWKILEKIKGQTYYEDRSCYCLNSLLTVQLSQRISIFLSKLCVMQHMDKKISSLSTVRHMKWLFTPWPCFINISSMVTLQSKTTALDKDRILAVDWLRSNDVMVVATIDKVTLDGIKVLWKWALHMTISTWVYSIFVTQFKSRLVLAFLTSHLPVNFYLLLRTGNYFPMISPYCLSQITCFSLVRPLGELTNIANHQIILGFLFFISQYT